MNNEIKFSIRTNHNVDMRLDYQSRLERAILRFGAYEPETIACIADHLDPDDVFWDIGANIGSIILSVEKLVPGIEGYAFEASPIVFSRLAAHCRTNESNVRPICVALGAEQGYATLSIKDQHEAGISSLTPWPEADYTIELCVPTDTADNIAALGTAPVPNVIKMDVEGHEEMVLKGMANLLAQKQLRVVVFEGQRELWERGEPDTPSQILSEAGFKIEKISQADRTYIAQRGVC